MCTEKQKKYIYWLSGQLGKEVDEEKLNDYTVNNASGLIQEMSEELDKLAAKNGSDNTKTTESFNPYRFGMCVKIVAQDFIESKHSFYTQNFVDDVERLYRDVTRIEKNLSGSSQEA